MKIQTLGLLVNARKADGVGLIPEITAACTRVGVSLLAESGTPMHDIVRDADALLVLGGDGTILHALSYMTDHMLPVLGVNIGTLGFLTECMPSAIGEAIARLAEGDFRLEPRMLLHARLQDDPTVYTALNDVVVSRGSFTRVVHADTYIDGVLASRFAGDGAIVASPTGSTAYSLSAGGPIIAPGMDCFVVTPICPHSLTNRPLVISSGARVRIELTPRIEDGGMLLSVDGAQCRILHERATLNVRRSDRTLPFIRFTQERFFELLRNKLTKWGVETLPLE